VTPSVSTPPPFAPRHIAGILAGVAALALMVLLPPPAPITEIGMARLGLLAFAVIWWVATPLPLAFTTLAVLGLGVGLGAMSIGGAFAHSSSWVLWFVIGTFGMGAALEATGVNHRFALFFLDLPWARGKPHRFLMMFLLSATVMSAFMANTIVAVLWLSLAVKIYELVGVRRDDPFVEANTLGVAWAANIGGIATPVGNGTNAPAMALVASATGVTITFLQWTIVGSVLALLGLAAALLIFRFAIPKGSAEFQRPELVQFISEERRRLGPMPAAERRALGWFVVAIVLWFIPDTAAYVMPGPFATLLQRQLHLIVPALLVPIAMCLTPVPVVASVVDADGQPRRFVLTWQEWMKGIDWGLVIFIGGVMGLGTAVGEVDTGIPAYVQATLQPWLGHLSEYTFVFLLSASVILVTSVISNMVTLAIFMPIGITLSQSLHIGDPVAIGLILGIGPSLDFMLPSGTTTNAIVAGSGYLRVSTMVKRGVLMFIVYTLLLTFIGYPLSKLLLGH
jgi:sodium-dependent dicarboxylate transporter 2/3/5